jgi:hypothetical protein
VSENFSAERASERVHVNNSHPVNTVRAQLAWTHEDAILYSPAWYWLLRGFSGLIRLIPLWQEEDEFIVEGLLNISWGLRRPIRLQMQDDNERIRPPPSSSSWHSGCNLGAQG